ncbi:succinate dehydrogenase / fumarate reductase cytochrome b subunit [Dysgonomonas sp. PH5-45]|uniref:succinate dehydrogenase cytochrome b subunit n=1 Tax=unclassified Dysgonomonas TaxID=2630389 RepID=UPI0024747910|nr:MULTISPECIES: succinate dehydrogenase cytochrome b subunit [unclassified Dysgonomonas]MDH6355996.1 succinate dehydrogenase / fumarate reductase cytochrome b subunit [Dysgonomonas sp. PH5-45]MDH6388891.1 succinate dehydrogenase / fumarate reductase cytochrome b subunit [Dysgonomonas sp. PH5-37]
MSWLLKSSIGRKFIMALSGCCLVLFLLFHMCMNVVSIISIEAYEAICGFLGTNWYAVLATGGLALLFIVHILYALSLTLKNKKARGNDSYAMSSSLSSVTWTSKNMFVLGVVVLVFLLLHLYDFWFKMMFAELFNLHDIVVLPEEVGGHMAMLFGSPVKVALYFIGIVALWLHLTHGVWSMFQSTGLNGRTWYPRLKCIGNIVATIICLGFLIVPIFFLAKHFLCGAC